MKVCVVTTLLRLDENIFNQDNYINLLLLKRSEFDHEKEIRLFIIRPETADQPKYLRSEKNTTPDQKFVPLEWSSVLEGVDIDINCSDYEKTLLVKALATCYGTSLDGINQQTFRTYYQQFNIREVDVYEKGANLTPITIE